MNDSSVLSKNPQQRTELLPRTSGISQTLNDHCVRRIAINTTAVLGSLYDARIDHVLGNLSLGTAPITKTSGREPVRCYVMNTDTCDSTSLLQIVGIYDELWLNLILNIVPAEGIVSLVNYSFPKNINTRFLYYYYSSQEQTISYQQNAVRACIPQNIPEITSTHIISAIKLGIQALIILQLSSGDETNLEYLLEKIRKQLIRNKFELTKKETSSLDRIIVTKVFSNIPGLLEKTKLADIHKSITELKSNVYCHLPLEYSLRGIQWFYPNYSTEKTKCIPLESSFLKLIKEYLLQLSSRITELNMSFEPEVEKTMKEHLKEQFDEVQLKIQKALAMDPVEAEQMRDLVLKSRSGTLSQEKATKMLIDKSEQSLQTESNLTTNHVEISLEKREIINNFEQADISYLNIPKKQSEHLHGSTSALKSAKSATTTNAFALKKQLTFEQQSTSLSKSPTTLISELVQRIEEQSENTEELLGPSKLKKSSTTEDTYSRKEQLVLRDEQPKQQTSSTRSTSQYLQALKDRSKESEGLFNSSISPKSSTIKHTLHQTEQFNYVDEFIYSSNLSTPTIPKASLRKEEQSKISTDLLNPSKSHKSLVTEDTLQPQKQPIQTEEQYNLSNSTTKLAVQNASQTREQTTNIEELFDSSKSSKPSTKECILPSKKQPIFEEDRTKLLSLSLISNSEPVQRIEKQSRNNEKPSSPSELRKLSPSDDTFTSSKQLNPVQKRVNQTSSSTLSTPGVTPPTKRHHPDSLPSSTVNYTNVLLLGESGVGKSTFINALVNYLAFETLEQAISQPLMVMPVSFLMTVGDNFEEQIVRFGGVDPNEDHDHPGQSVTQHCRSYIFDRDNETKLRIIDTPGMGDTRGLDQDDLNIQHILSFINNLSHLNAICILLKPNESRLNIVLRSYFTRLLNFLGENARNNIVFCFTNTRATFFAPGNTGPLIKKMISSSSIKAIPFGKPNTFCFDSESFRYLIALRNGIKFDEYQRKEYRLSWKTSVTESNRFFKYICSELVRYSQNEWQSIEHAQFKITQMVRPMLETARNLFRNIILLKENSSKLVIKLHPVDLSQPSTICYKCKRTPRRYSDFWILPDDLHVISNKCGRCRCDLAAHMNVDYKLEYEPLHYTSVQSFDEMTLNLDQLRVAIQEFALVYNNVGDTSNEDDPILRHLKRMIGEENEICSQKGSQCLNWNLHNELTRLRKDYKEKRNIAMSNRKPIDLSNIYEQIKRISQISDVSEQISVIRQAQERYMKQHEKQAS